MDAGRRELLERRYRDTQLVELTALVESDGRVTSALVPVGAGVRLIVREP